MECDSSKGGFINFLYFIPILQIKVYNLHVELQSSYGAVFNDMEVYRKLAKSSYRMIHSIFS
ncbi:hypothetical protein BIV59_20905 [Bacillus sp. MUM 13]|nr:hypothetical protein BIV59_20905 [Bacillus sp. MUM 13]